MRLYEALFTYLSGVTAVTDLIGVGTACKLRELYIERSDTLPYVAVEVTDTERFHHFGAVPAASLASVQIDSFATTESGASALSEAIYLALVRQEAAMESASGLTVLSITFDSKSQSYEWDEETDVKMFSSLMTFKIIYSI